MNNDANDINLDSNVPPFSEGELIMERWTEVSVDRNYKVSNQGRVQNRRTGRILKPQLKSGGYYMVSLSSNGKPQVYLIHHLVLVAFKGSCPKGYLCNHKNFIKTDNNIDNLEWVSPKYNNQHAYKGGRFPIQRGTTHGRAKLRECDIILIRELNKIKEYTQKRIARMFGVATTTISCIVTNRSWKHV